MKDGKACGVMAGDEELEADLVICADGVNSLLVEGTGTLRQVNADNIALGVKLVICLPKQAINDRFSLLVEQGAACLMVGDCSKGIAGGGFLYTNRESLSLGLVIDSAALKTSRKNIGHIVENFKEHPAILPLIEGGHFLEYSAY
jgi:electron transfer flavoprotein-quinone oxidoreductase